MSDKGQSFEREESRFLSLWWTNQKMDDVFWRNRIKITSKTPHGEKQLGDITANHSVGLPFVEMFNIELKSGYARLTVNQARKNLAERNRERIRKGKEPVLTASTNAQWDLLDVIDSKQKDDNLIILNFWKQCETDALISDRIPLLIFKRDFHSPIVCIYKPSFEEIIDHSGQPPSRRIVLITGGTEKDNILTFYRHSDFFKWFDPDVIRLIHRRKMESRDVQLAAHSELPESQE